MPAMSDLIETLLGIPPDSKLAKLRAQRADIRQHTEGAFRELVTPADPGGVTHAERAALALRVATIEHDEPLAAHCRAILQNVGTAADLAAAETVPANPKTRLGLLLHYADLVAVHPEHSTQATIDRLTAQGLSPQDIVAVTQLVSFIPFQVRLLAGLRALQGEKRMKHFTLETVGWEPRLPPVTAEAATPEQQAALDACPPGVRTSKYFLTLAQDPRSLGERGALFNSVMYAPRGLPRAERETGHRHRLNRQRLRLLHLGPRPPLRRADA